MNKINQDKRGKISLNQISIDDVVFCLENSQRLLKDAFLDGISRATQTALVELSMEEAAKGLLLFSCLRLPNMLLDLGIQNFDKEVDRAFRRHEVKIKLLRAYIERAKKGLESTSEEEYLKGVARETKELEEGAADLTDEELLKIAKEGYTEEMQYLVSRMYTYPNELSVDDFKAIKENALYVGKEVGTGKPLYPTGIKFEDVGILAMLVYSILAVYYREVGHIAHMKDLNELRLRIWSDLISNRHDKKTGSVI